MNATSPLQLAGSSVRFSSLVMHRPSKAVSQMHMTMRDAGGKKGQLFTEKCWEGWEPGHFQCLLKCFLITIIKEKPQSRSAGCLLQARPAVKCICRQRFCLRWYPDCSDGITQCSEVQVRQTGNWKVSAFGAYFLKEKKPQTLKKQKNHCEYQQRLWGMV